MKSGQNDTVLCGYAEKWTTRRRRETTCLPLEGPHCDSWTMDQGFALMLRISISDLLLRSSTSILRTSPPERGFSCQDLL